MIETKPIRDPVYNYVDITPIEQALIDQPAFQRLRFILQNSSAFLTYPNNLNMRFLHSLGVMHLSGEMFRKAMENASAGNLEGYLGGVRSLVKLTAEQVGSNEKQILCGWRRLLGNASRFNHHPVKGSPIKVDESTLFYINLLWQSVRLCAVIHDIGHFPMSHVFEDAIRDFREFYDGPRKSLFEDDYASRSAQFEECLEAGLKEEFLQKAGAARHTQYDAIPLHEWWGFKIFRSLQPQDPKWDDDVKALCRLSYRLAKIIFLVNRPPGLADIDSRYQPLRCLHTIVSSDLDADRLDYCVRDPYSSGLELGAIDVRRIEDSMILHRDGEHYWVLPRNTAISALESFFHQRYLLYQYLIYHHNVVRMDGIVKEILIRFLEEAVGGDANSTVPQALEQLGFWRQKGTRDGFHLLSHARFEHYDDAWLRCLMAEVRCRLVVRKKEGDKLTANESMLLRLLSTFLDRRRGNVYSLWKFDTSFQKDLAAIAKALGIQEEQGRTGAFTILQMLRDAGGTQKDDPEQTPPLLEQVVHPLKTELSQRGVCLIYRYLVPKILGLGDAADGALRVVVAEDEALEAWRLSPYLKSLEGVARETPCIHFSFVSDNIKNDNGLQLTCREMTLNKLQEFVKLRSEARLARAM